MKTGNSTLFAFAWLTVSFAMVGVKQVQMGPNSDSCSSCHSLADVLPEGHSRDGVETFESCLTCHSAEGTRVALGWIVHWKHYALDEFPGDCWSCHWMDERSRFGLLGTNGGVEGKISRDQIEKMSSYFESWASSAYLDRVHGQQGTECLDCHSSSFPDEPASMRVCLGCYGSYSGLSELTADADPNPHASHVGEVDCGHCHKSHEESVLVCNQCHNYNLEVPKSAS